MAPNGDLLSPCDIQSPNCDVPAGMERTRALSVANGPGRFPLSERARNHVKRSSAASATSARSLRPKQRLSRPAFFKAPST